MFGLPHSLGPSDQVIASEQGSGARVVSDKKLSFGMNLVKVRQIGRPLGHRAYLFWADLAHDADFEHPSVLLLLNASNGHVLLEQTLAFYPLIDGRLPAFLATAAAYDGPQYQIYSNEGPHLAKSAQASASTHTPTARVAQALAVNPASFSHDCMIIMGDRNDPRKQSNFGNDMDTMAALGREIGLKPVEAEPANFGNDLSKLLAGPPKCDDVVVFLAGHGTPAQGANIPNGKGGTVPETALPTVDLGEHQVTHKDDHGHDVTESLDYEITSEWIKEVVKNFTPAHFKFIISSCFSGRFQAALQGVPGITLLATSSQATQFSYRDVKQITIGGQTIDNPNPHPTKAGEFVNGLKLGFDLIIKNASLVAADGGENLAALLNAAINTNGTNAVSSAGIAVPTSTYTPPPPPPPTPGPKPTPINFDEFGDALEREPDRRIEATEDYVMWMLEQVFGAVPASAMGGLTASARSEPRAKISSTGGTLVPANGQVTQIKVRGYYVPGHCPVNDSVCQENVHFQDLRPLPTGKLEIVSTTQAFTLSSTPGTYTFQPTNFFVQKGDYIGFSTVGGAFQVLVSAPGAQTAMFVGHNQDMNGDQVSSNNPQSGAELSMRVTLQPSG